MLQNMLEMIKANRVELIRKGIIVLGAIAAAVVAVIVTQQDNWTTSDQETPGTETDQEA